MKTKIDAIRLCDNQFNTVLVMAILLITAALSNKFPEDDSLTIKKPCRETISFKPNLLQRL